ncbi:hypothetical protein BgiBS90_022984 [Biomphalaria glabrata]|nr:hypothetical protein BgiBS90_022984 [Biomphalaria glabrata]
MTSKALSSNPGRAAIIFPFMLNANHLFLSSRSTKNPTPTPHPHTNPVLKNNSLTTPTHSFQPPLFCCLILSTYSVGSPRQRSMHYTVRQTLCLVTRHSLELLDPVPTTVIVVRFPQRHFIPQSTFPIVPTWVLDAGQWFTLGTILIISQRSVTRSTR